VKINRLEVAYGPIVAVRRFDAEIKPGQVVAVIGPNGAGKSSLLAAIGGQVPHGGTVELAGARLDGMPSHRRARAGLGFVPSGRGVFPSITVRDHVRIAAGARDAEMWERLVGWFPILGDKQKALGSNLSGGQQQIVSIARAMAADPRFLLMDEPSIGLSPVATDQLAAAVRTLAEQNVGVLLTEQNAGLALKLSDFCLLMVRGETRLSGSPAELRDRPEIEALYLGRSVENAT
jgi:branched-chain amino acid transport system ATP-binding protein